MQAKIRAVENLKKLKDKTKSEIVIVPTSNVSYNNIKVIISGVDITHDVSILLSLLYKDNCLRVPVYIHNLGYDVLTYVNRVIADYDKVPWVDNYVLKTDCKYRLGAPLVNTGNHYFRVWRDTIQKPEKKELELYNIKEFAKLSYLDYKTMGLIDKTVQQLVSKDLRLIVYKKCRYNKSTTLLVTNSDTERCKTFNMYDATEVLAYTFYDNFVGDDAAERVKVYRYLESLYNDIEDRRR